MQNRPSKKNRVWTVFFSLLTALALNACGDSNNVSAPPAPALPGPLTILTASPLPAGTTAVPYDITLAPSGGTPPYTWSLAPSSPTLPNGLTLNPSTGNIIGTPTATGTTPTEFKLLDSKGQSVQKVLSIGIRQTEGHIFQGDNASGESIRVRKEFLRFTQILCRDAGREDLAKLESQGRLCARLCPS